MNIQLSMIGLFLLACNSDESIKVFNSDPEATITSHTEGSELLEAVEYTFVGQVNDANHQNEELLVTWSTNNKELCAQAAASTTGESSCQAALELGDNELRIQVTDPEGAASLTSISITIIETNAPTITLSAPLEDNAYYSDQLIPFAAIIQDEEDNVQDLLYTWSSSLDGDLPIEGEPDTDGAIEGYANLSEGQHAISLRVEDTTGKSKTETVAITVGGPNNDPTCEITEPAEQTPFVDGQSISFAGTVNDDDINNSLLNISWESNVDGVFDTTAANTAGELGFAYADLSIGSHTITLKVEDEVGGLCTDTVQLSVGTPPTLTLSSPSDGAVYSVGDSVSFQGTLSDQEDIVSDISLSWNSDIDGEFSTQGANSNGNISFSTSSLSSGLHNMSVVATDSTGLTDSASFTITINTPPSISNVAISGGSYNTDTLTCSATATDPDETLTPSYSWTIDSVQIGTGASVDLSTTSALPEDDVVCSASATDSNGATASATATVSLLNRAPTAPTVSITPSAPVQGEDDLVCNITTASTDADGQTVSYTYEWTKDASSTAYTTDTVPAVDVGAEELWTCTVTPDDGIDFGTSASDSVTSVPSCIFADCDETVDLGGGQGIDFVLIPSGSFSMGSPTSEVGRATNEDLHTVALTNDFLVSTTEVTQGMYQQLIGYDTTTNKATSNSLGSFGIGDDYPVFFVTWHMAAEFANALTQQYNNINGTTLQECYTCTGTNVNATCSTAVQPIYSCTGFRLLTEAEWEYTARAGTTQAFWTSNGGGELPTGYIGSTTTLSDGFSLDTYGWYEANNSTTYGSKEVATLMPNSFGVYDMSGNLWEWTHDGYEGNLGTTSTIDPVSESTEQKTIRGGAWPYEVAGLRSARRGNYGSTLMRNRVGFRVGKTN